MAGEDRAKARNVELVDPAGQVPAFSEEEPAAIELRKAPPRRKRRQRRKVRILFFSANTYSRGQLALDQEYREIDQRLNSGRYRGAFRLIANLAARRSDVEQALLRYKPDVVHFACHGSAQAEVVLLTNGEGSEPMSAAALSSLFAALPDRPTLVVFNACFASGQASAVRPHTRFAIGMRERIDDRAAIAFASALYGALADGQSVAVAFRLGAAAVEAVNARQKDFPRLFHATGADPSKAPLVWPRPVRRPHWLLAAAVVGALLILAGARWLPGHRPGHVPPRGMAGFDAADVRPGVFEMSQRPRECSPPGGEVDCAELAHPEQVTSARVEAFDLDVMEVTTGDFATWLNGSAESWRVQKTQTAQVIATRREPSVPLVVAGERCGLSINAEGHVIADPDKIHWPVVCVTWYGAREYCREHQKRLPSDVEWELAAKDSDGRPFPWGDKPPRPDAVAYGLRDGAARHPIDVGSSLQDVSPHGVHDLGGNVAEWVEDRRDDGATRMTRGGSWNSINPCRLLGSSCQPQQPNRASTDIGFRCASSVLENR